MIYDEIGDTRTCTASRSGCKFTKLASSRGNEFCFSASCRSDSKPKFRLNSLKNVNMIQRVVVLLVPGLTPEILSLPLLPTSATSNPNLPISIPLLSPTPVRSSTDEDVDDGTDPISTAACIPFIASTFSHACPTRAPGDQTKMHSVLSSFFTGPITIEEKKKKDLKREQCVSCVFFFHFHE